MNLKWLRNAEVITIRQHQNFIFKFVGVLAVILISILINSNIITISNLWIATVITLITTLILPGYLLADFIFDNQTLSWPEKLPIAFVLGLGLLSIPAVLFLFWQAQLSDLALASIAINVVLGGLYIWVTKYRVVVNRVATPYLIEPPNRILMSVTILAVAGVVIFYVTTASPWSLGDNWTYLLHIRRYLDDTLTPTTNYLMDAGETNERVASSSWVILQALLSHIAGGDLIDIYTFSLPSLLIILSILSIYSLAKELFANQNAALLTVLLQILYCFSSIGVHDWIGRGFFGRIIEDKFLIWFIVLPVTTLVMLKYLTSGQMRHFIALFLSTIALGLIHPIGLVQWGISLSLFIFIHLIFRQKWDNLTRLGFVYFLFLLLLSIPLLQRQALAPVQGKTQGVSFDYLSGLDIQLSLSQTRLWVFSAIDNHYMAHPYLVAHPMTILAILLTPLLIGYLRESLAAQFLFANMAGVLLLLYNPLTAPLLGRLITPWMIWRISWLLPVSLTIVFFLYRMPGWLQGVLPERGWSLRSFSLLPLMPVVLILFMGGLLSPYIRDGLSFLRDQKAINLTEAERGLLDYLQREGGLGGAVLARPQFSTYIPAFSSKLQLLTFRFAGDEAALKDIEHFYRANLVTEATLSILSRWQVGYVIMENNHPLSLQFDRLPVYFEKRFQNEEVALYEILDSLAPNHLVQGNTYFIQGDWQAALRAYEEALIDDPGQSLAYLGRGYVYEDLGQPKLAESFYQQVITEQPENTLAHLALLKLYTTEGDFDKAIQQGKAVTNQQPNSLVAHELLGDLYLQQGDKAAAFEQYQQSIPFAIETADYYLTLGNLYRVRALETEAVAAYQHAVTLPQYSGGAIVGAYDELGGMYLASGNIEEAAIIYRRIADLGWPLNQVGYERLRQVYLSRGDTEQTIGLYQEAIRRHTNAAWPHLELGQLYLRQISE